MTTTLKVLLMPDVFPWILGTWAKQIALHGQRHQYYFFSAQMISRYPEEFKALVQMVDVLHLLPQHGIATRLALPEDKAQVGAIHHVVEWNELEPITHTADKISYISIEWKDYLLDKGVPQEKLFEIRQGVDADFFRPWESRREARHQLGIDTDQFLIGFFSKFSSDHGGRKGTDVLIQTLDQLKQRDKEIGVLITGPGWQALVRSLQATGLSVYYFPFLPNEMMPMAYNALDTYLVASRIEGGCGPLVEAMACGIPVVTTPVGMAIQFVEDMKNGLLIPKNSPDATVEALLTLKDDRQLAQQISQNGRQTIVEHLQWRDIFKDIDTLYDQAVENRAQRLATQGMNIDPNQNPKPGKPQLIDPNPTRQQKAALLEDNLIWHSQLFEEGNHQAALQLSFETWKTYAWNTKAGRRFLRLNARHFKRKAKTLWSHDNTISPVATPGAKLKDQTVAWIHAMQEQTPSGFDFLMSADSQSTLLSHCFAILGLQLFDALATVSSQQRQRWISQISNCYQSDSGLFVEPDLNSEEVPEHGHNWDYLTWQSTFFALMALNALDEPSRYPLHFLDRFKSPSYIRDWLEQRDWRNPWLESNNVMFITSFLIQHYEQTRDTQTADTLTAIFDWLDEHQNPITGYWDLGQGASLLNAMAGAYHFYFLYFYTGRPVHYPERIIESTLSLQQPDGLFDPYGGGSACLDLDAVDILVKFSLLTGYRADAIKTALTAAFNGLLQNQNPDGSFCEAKRPPLWKKSRKRRLAELTGMDRFLGQPWQGRPVEYTSYSSWSKMRYRLDGGDMWSTWFRPLALALISTRYPGQFTHNINWRFPARPVLGWHNSDIIKMGREL